MDERGGATSVEMAVLWIAMLGMIIAVVQVALLYYAGRLALGAAEDGVRSGRAYGAEPVSAARRDAQEFLARAAGSTLRDPVVTAAIDESGLLRVRVRGTALSLVPGVPMDVDREAVGGLERLAP